MDRPIASIARDAEAAVAVGLEAMARHLEAELRNTLGVQAPLAPGRKRPMAATPATPGAPPRRISGDMQAAVASVQVDEHTWRVGVFDIPYARKHEESGHPWLSVTLEREAGRLGDVFARAVADGVST